MNERTPRDAYDEEESATETEGGPAALPPELASRRDELQEALAAVLLAAHRITKSEAQARQLLSDVYVKLTTTRRYDPGRGVPLLKYAVVVLKGELQNQQTSKKARREAASAERYHREVLPAAAASPEQQILDRAEEEERDREADDDLAELERRVAAHPLAPRVLACKRQDPQRKASAIAAELKVPVLQVYRALDLLKHHLQRIRAERGQDPKDPEDS